MICSIYLQQVPVTVFNEDDNPVGLLVSSNMKAREACHKLAMINKVDDDPHWVLAEYLTDLGLGKYINLIPKSDWSGPQRDLGLQDAKTENIAGSDHYYSSIESCFN